MGIGSHGARMPELWELIGLFECEPELLDKDVIWFYNHLTFVTERGRDKVRCELEPAYRSLDFRWWRDGVEVVHLDVRGIAGMAVELGQQEYLTAEFGEQPDITPQSLIIRLRPTVHVFWGTQEEGESGIRGHGAE